MPASKIIVALDFQDENSALTFLKLLDPQLCRVKIGKELFVHCGPSLLEKIQKNGFEVFLDLKFYDIPNTVAAACRAAADLGVWMLNVHASGGLKMMVAAQNELSKSANPPLLIAVTVLTSFNDEQLKLTGVTRPVKDQVLHLASLTQQAGLSGVVCSPLEAAMLKDNFKDDLLLVTPGVRPLGSAVNDQQRIMTPADALQAGSDYLVIGRPITAAENPLSSLKSIIASIQ